MGGGWVSVRSSELRTPGELFVSIFTQRLLPRKSLTRTHSLPAEEDAHSSALTVRATLAIDLPFLVFSAPPVDDTAAAGLVDVPATAKSSPPISHSGLCILLITTDPPRTAVSRHHRPQHFHPVNRPDARPRIACPLRAPLSSLGFVPGSERGFAHPLRLLRARSEVNETFAPLNRREPPIIARDELPLSRP